MTYEVVIQMAFVNKEAWEDFKESSLDSPFSYAMAYTVLEEDEE